MNGWKTQVPWGPESSLPALATVGLTTGHTMEASGQVRSDTPRGERVGHTEREGCSLHLSPQVCDFIGRHCLEEVCLLFGLQLSILNNQGGKYLPPAGWAPRALGDEWSAGHVCACVLTGRRGYEAVSVPGTQVRRPGELTALWAIRLPTPHAVWWPINLWGSRGLEL